MNEDQLTLLTLDLRPVPDLLRSGAIFEHVQRSPSTFPTMPLRWHSLPIKLRSLPFNSRLFPIGPDFQIGLNREQIVAQWNGGINWTLRNKLQWNFDRNSYIFIEENTFENVVREMSTLLSRPQNEATQNTWWALQTTFRSFSWSCSMC